MDRDLLRHAYAVKFVISNQCIRDITEGSLDRLFVSDQLLPSLRFGESKITAQLTTLKDRLCDVCGVTPGGEIGIQSPPEHSRHSISAAAGGGQSNLREESSFGDSDFRIGGDEVLLGLRNVRTTREQ